MSYAELRAAGIELPASVVSELELAGVQIERCYGGAGGQRRVVGVRLAEPLPKPEQEPDPEPASKPSPIAATPPPGWRAVHVYRPRAPSMRLLVSLAVAAAVVIVGVLALTGLSGGSTHARHAAAQRRARASPRLAATSSPSTHRPTPTTPVPPTPVSPALATQLESQGHALLDSGQYVSAIPVLRRAVAATGEQSNACLEPTGVTCLTYAYALYDLGRALRLSGNPAAAVPILEARLQIDNQRPTVAAELQLARERGA
ncbi:MAG TPA: hypothetical protein VMP89_12700 [Solirubrobacteraceae bacterium]|nr:hypothetical protein [Solirubrobacteraceae bacterium]